MVLGQYTAPLRLTCSGSGALIELRFIDREDGSVARSPRYALLSLQNSLSEVTGPRFGHTDIGALDNDLILNYAHGGEPVGERLG